LLVVQVVRGGEVDDVDAVVVQNRLERVVRLGEVVGVRLGGGAFAARADDAGDFDAEATERLDVDDADEAGAGDRRSDVPE
jgi:hypothetical protein